MGAFGAALIGRERCEEGHVSTIIPYEELSVFEAKVSSARCGRCENRCLLTINTFSDGKKFITGNRCEKGAGILRETEEVPNLYKYKYERLFSYYKPLEEDEAPRGTVGIPRVLNMYENYPFWFTLFTKLGFRVVLSPHSSKAIYDLGIETISSDTACYPAKLVHGHIKSLVNQGIKHIFYPSINHEVIEDEKKDNHYNCPIVATYPEVVKNNMDECFDENDTWFDHPFMPYHNKEKLAIRFYEHYKGHGITLAEVKAAVKAAEAEDTAFKNDIRNKADEIIKSSREIGRKVVVLAGRPYHLDPEINHGLDEIITAYGMAVITEDSIAHLAHDPRRFRVLNQWTYHSRLYRAAEVVSETDDMELIQINSFGCGVDAVTTDQVNEILDLNNKLYTLIKIDEGANLGAARIRIRSLKVAVEDRERNGIKPERKGEPYVNRVEFTKDMRKDYTLLFPQMAPYHFGLLEQAFGSEGYNVKLLPKTDKQDIEYGLKYLNNDACYPTIVSLGQLIRAVQSG
ncbi:MAG: 2-hydroxyacyl-CoA dehydratase, partial [Firmicutes bacterium]|nr:2-hydroxyacyl-CoA dehydratase [Bacillota bacterium]